MEVSLFDFHLPQACIAQCPARPRDSARLLHVPARGGLNDLIVRDLLGLLRAGDVMVFNSYLFFLFLQNKARQTAEFVRRNAEDEKRSVKDDDSSSHRRVGCVYACVYVWWFGVGIRSWSLWCQTALTLKYSDDEITCTTVGSPSGTSCKLENTVE